MSTADSLPAPWSEVEKHIRRAEREIQERQGIKNVHRLGVFLTVIGFGSLMAMVVGIATDPAAWAELRAIVSPLAHMVGIGGMVMIASAYLADSQRRRCEAIARHHAHHHQHDQAEHHEISPATRDEIYAAGFADGIDHASRQPVKNMRLLPPPGQPMP